MGVFKALPCALAGGLKSPSGGMPDSEPGTACAHPDRGTAPERSRRTTTTKAACILTAQPKYKSGFIDSVLIAVVEVYPKDTAARHDLRRTAPPRERSPPGGGTPGAVAPPRKSPGQIARKSPKNSPFFNKSVKGANLRIVPGDSLKK